MEKLTQKMIAGVVAVLFGASSLVLAGTTPVATLQYNSGPYGQLSATVSISTYTGLSNGSLTAVCDDFNDGITQGESWTIGVETLQDIINAASNSAGEMFTSNTQGLNIVQSYEAAMWLTGQILDLSSNTASGTYGTTQDLNWALWALFSSSAEAQNAQESFSNTNFYYDAQAQTDLTDAVNGVTGGTITASDFTNYLVLTPQPSTQCNWYGSNCEMPQEFITRTAGPTSAPEPASIMLLGIVLLGFGLVTVRSGQRQAAR